jgi:hypothetical protein
MTRQDFDAKWTTLRDEWSRRGFIAPVGQVIGELLADLEAVARDEGTELLTLTQAAERSGFHRDTLGRMVASGALQNMGRKNAPRVRAVDLPRKALRPASRISQVQDASRQSARASTKTPRGGE